MDAETRLLLLLLKLLVYTVSAGCMAIGILAIDIEDDPAGWLLILASLLGMSGMSGMSGMWRIK